MTRERESRSSPATIQKERKEGQKHVLGKERTEEGDIDGVLPWRREKERNKGDRKETEENPPSVGVVREKKVYVHLGILREDEAQLNRRSEETSSALADAFCCPHFFLLSSFNELCPVSSSRNLRRCIARSVSSLLPCPPPAVLGASPPWYFSSFSQKKRHPSCLADSEPGRRVPYVSSGRRTRSCTSSGYIHRSRVWSP